MARVQGPLLSLAAGSRVLHCRGQVGQGDHRHAEALPPWPPYGDWTSQKVGIFLPDTGSLTGLLVWPDHSLIVRFTVRFNVKQLGSFLFAWTIQMFSAPSSSVEYRNLKSGQMIALWLEMAIHKER